MLKRTPRTDVVRLPKFAFVILFFSLCLLSVSALISATALAQPKAPSVEAR
jgi:ABC-type transport system involved in multi-copper enzyme maturation permease subunit